MSKVTIPSPTAWMLAVQTMSGDVGWKLSWSQSGAGVCRRLSGEAHEKPLITTTQAEAYKDACVREALGWQPIETAPKHTEVLVWREDSGPFIAKLTDPYEVIQVEEMERENMEFPDDFEEWYSDAYGWQEGSEKPTHWMPLPPPPTKESKNG